MDTRGYWRFIGPSKEEKTFNHETSCYSTYWLQNSTHLAYHFSSFFLKKKTWYPVTEILLSCYYHIQIIWYFPPIQGLQTGNSQMKHDLVSREDAVCVQTPSPAKRTLFSSFPYHFFVNYPFNQHGKCFNCLLLWKIVRSWKHLPY